MGDILDFKPRSQTAGQAAGKRKVDQKRQKADKPEGGAETRTPDRESVLLWQMAQDIDAIVRHAILEKKLTSAEVAAVLAHRLGTLIALDDRSPEALSEFCCRILRRIGLGDDSGSHAG